MSSLVIPEHKQQITRYLDMESNQKIETIKMIAKEQLTQDADDLFRAMQEKFNASFEQRTLPQKHNQDSKQLLTSESDKKTLLSRQERKVKPIYSSVNRRKQQNQNLCDYSDSQHENKLLKDDKQSNPTSEINNSGCLPFNQENDQKNTDSPIGKIYSQHNHDLVNNVSTHQKVIHLRAGDESKNQRNLTEKQNEQNPGNINFHTQVQKSPKVMNYTDLQQKIQSALKKSSHYKAFGTSRLSKSNFTSRSFNEFQELLINRFEECQKKKEKQIEQKRQQLVQQQQKNLKFHPQINKKSLKIIQEMGGHQPIEHRYEKIIQAKCKKTQRHEQQKKQKQQEEFQQYMEQFLKHKKSFDQKTRSSEEFYEQMLKWKQRALKNAQEKKKITEEKVIQEANNFRPKINKKSEIILKNSTKSQRYLPIYERQVPSIQQKKFKSKIDEECTFKPKINKRKVK